MLFSLLTALAAAQPTTAAPRDPATDSAAVQAPATPAQKKARKKCDTMEEAEVGSHIVTCSTKDEFQRVKEAHQAQQAITFSGIPVERAARGPGGPH